MNDVGTPTKTPEELSTLLSLFIAEAMRYDTDTLLRFVRREDLTLPLMTALCVVERRGTLSIGELATSLDFSLGNASMLVDKLVCNGCVTRVENASDRRHKQVGLTPKGHALVSELRAARAEDVAQHLRQLPLECLERTVALLRDVTAELRLINQGAAASIPKAAGA